MKRCELDQSLFGRCIRGFYKIKNTAYSLFEKKRPVNNERNISLSEMTIMVENFIEFRSSNFHISTGQKCARYSTHLHSNRSYITLAQERLVMSYINLYRKKHKNGYLNRAIAIGRYIERSMAPEGIIPFHKPFFYPQDEGVSTYWAIPCFTELFNETSDSDFLRDAIELGEGGRNLLFGDKYGYTHTLGQKIWCPNVSAIAAYAYKSLHEATGNQKYLRWARDGLKFSADKMKKTGLFPYSETRPTLYMSIYQAITMALLMPFLKDSLGSEFNVSDRLRRACAFLKTLIREDGSVMEPEMKCYAYLPSMVATLAVLKYIGEKEYFVRVSNFIKLFFQTKSPFLCISFDKKLYNGSMIDFHDVLMTEVLYWLTTIVDNNGV